MSSFTLRMPTSLGNRVRDLAAAEKKSLNKYILDKAVQNCAVAETEAEKAAVLHEGAGCGICAVVKRAQEIVQPPPTYYSYSAVGDLLVKYLRGEITEARAMRRLHRIQSDYRRVAEK